MTKSQFLRTLSARHPEMTAEEVSRLANRVFEEISRQLGEGGRVEIRGFGTFLARRLNPRRARNPRSGESLEILARRIPRFRAGAVLRKKVDNLPRGGKATRAEAEED